MFKFYFYFFSEIQDAIILIGFHFTLTPLHQFMGSDFSQRVDVIILASQLSSGSEEDEEGARRREARADE